MLDMNTIFNTAVAKGASDIIITTGSPPLLRINGELLQTSAPSLFAEDVQKLIYSLLKKEQIERLELEKELDLSITTKAGNRFRVNFFFQRKNMAASFRLIPNAIPSSNELRLPKIVEDLAFSKQGFILVTGPTGSGKTTTIATMIDLINTTKRVHIVTVEDPIEYVHPNKKSVIEQREVGDDTLSFAQALKYVLRQNPDVIVVGEMRDIESIAAALTAAETGHLVFATLHTNDSVQAIDRIVDVFPAHQQGQIRSQLASSLLASIAQRLLSRIDTSGRIVATEVLINTPAVSNCIRENKIHQIYTILETSAKEGMHSFDSSYKELYYQRLISLDLARSMMRDSQAIDRQDKEKRSSLSSTWKISTT